MAEVGSRVVTHDLSERAVRAAAGVATAHGVRVDQPVVLADNFNLVVWLRPAPVVARVATLTSILRSAVDDLVRRELAVAAFLAGRGVSVVRPSVELDPGPHERDRLWLSFWEKLDVEQGTATPREVGVLLRALHDVLRDYPGISPALDVPVQDIEGFLNVADRFTEVSHRDIDAAARELGRLRPSLRCRGATQQLHGDAHPGNLLWTARGWTWIDFEESARGPIGWDLACLRQTGRLDGARALRAYGVEDEESLRPMMDLRPSRGPPGAPSAPRCSPSTAKRRGSGSPTWPDATWSLPGRVHDHGDAGEAHGRAGDVPAVGPETVHQDTPQQRTRHEHPAVGGQDAAEVRVGLQRRHESVSAQREHSGADPREAPPLPNALPHEPRPADLRHGCQGEQDDRAQDGHGARLSTRLPARCRWDNATVADVLFSVC
jgi:hypothetical protein